VHGCQSADLTRSGRRPWYASRQGRRAVARPAPPPWRTFAVNLALTATRCQGYLDTMKTRRAERGADEYIAFLRRIVRSTGKRVSAADVEQLQELIEVRRQLDSAIAVAVEGLRASGFTWDEIGNATGTSRQAAHQKWGGHL